MLRRMTSRYVTNFVGKNTRQLPARFQILEQTLSDENLSARQCKCIYGLWIGKQMKVISVLSFTRIALAYDLGADIFNQRLPHGIAALATILLFHLRLCLQTERNFLLSTDGDILF